MVLPEIGIALAVVGHLRTVGLSIAERIANYKHGKEKYQSLGENVAGLTEHIEAVDKVLKNIPKESRANIDLLFGATLEHIRKNLEATNEKVENAFGAFAADDKKFMGKAIKKGIRIGRADALKEKLIAVEAEIKDSSTRLLHIANALNSLELHNAIMSKSNVIISKLDKLANVQSDKEDYHPPTSAPALPHTVHLDFTTKDAQGRFETPEGKLKQKVRSSTLSETCEPVIAATGVMAAAKALRAAYAVVGMAGVGKTIALRGLANDEEIRGLFPDGVLYMTFGQGASVQDAIGKVVEIMEATGASSSIAAVENSRSLENAVNVAVRWFQGKTCLFLVDDLWPIDGCSIGYLKDLRQLLRCSPKSRMAISTRDVNIALAGCVVRFGPRDRLGHESICIFMRYATSTLPDDARKEYFGKAGTLSVSKEIISWCGGLPIALSVTGSAVNYLLMNLGCFEHECVDRSYSCFERACEMYRSDFEEEETMLGEEEDPEGRRLSDGIRVSLKYLDDKLSNWKEKKGVVIEHTMSELYTSLCILTNQLWVPVSTLKLMWKVEAKSARTIVKFFCDISLATLSPRTVGNGSTEKMGLSLHDLHLEFCKQQAESKHVTTRWHSAVLNGYLDSSLGDVLPEPCALSSQQLVELRARRWWSCEIAEDGYVHANVARHLSLCGRGSELAALVLDARWGNARGKHGGILGVKEDFEILDKVLEVGERGQEENVPLRNIRKGFKLILKAMQLSWGNFRDGERAYQLQVCGRLVSLRSKNSIVDILVRSFEEHTSKPYVVPVSSFFPAPSSAQITEIPVGSRCLCVAWSPCGRYIAAGSGEDVVVADAITGVATYRLVGLEGFVGCVRFFSGEKKLVAADCDGKVGVWEWEKSDSPILVLEGHQKAVMSVVVSRDGGRIVSGSHDKTLRMWDLKAGLPPKKFYQRSGVECICFCADERNVAIGLENETLKVLNVDTGNSIFEHKEAHEGGVWSVALSPDGRRLGTCSSGAVRLWDAETGDLIGEHLSSENFSSVAFSCNRQHLVTSSSQVIRLWDVSSSQPLETVSNSAALREIGASSVEDVTHAEFNYDGTRIVTASYIGFVRVWDAMLDSKETQGRFGHKRRVFSVAISSDGLRVASGSADGSVRLWCTKSGLPIGTPREGHTDMGNGVRCVAFSRDGHRIVSGGTDMTVRLWNVHNRMQIGDPLIGHRSYVKSVAESSGGDFVVSRDWGEETIIWNRASGALVWRSGKYTYGWQNTITGNRAEAIISDYGQGGADSSPEHPDELYCDDLYVYSNMLGERTLLGHLPALILGWKYDAKAKVFAAGLSSGAVAICRLEK